MQTLILNFLQDTWTITIVGGIIVTVVGGYFFKKLVGDRGSKKLVVEKPKNSPTIQAGRVSGGIQQTTVYGVATRTRPSLDIRTDGHSGGPDGVTAFFVVRNDGSESARNITLRFMDGESLFKEERIPNLTTNESARVTYEYTNTAYFLTKLTTPRLVLHYTAVDGRQFESGAYLIQENCADRRFNLSVRLGESFDRAISKLTDHDKNS